MLPHVPKMPFLDNLFGGFDDGFHDALTAIFRFIPIAFSLGEDRAAYACHWIDENALASPASVVNRSL